MYSRLTDLVQATKDMFATLDTDLDEAVFSPSSGKQLVAAATSCVRSSGDCVAKARLVIEKIGDFEFETAGLGLSQSIFEQIEPAEPQEDDDTTQKISEPVKETEKPLPAPPAEEQGVLARVITSETKPLPDIPEQSPSDTESLELPPTIPAAIAESPDTAARQRRPCHHLRRDCDVRAHRKSSWRHIVHYQGDKER
jgi:type IV secretory pathway VirB10-like protein